MENQEKPFSELLIQLRLRAGWTSISELATKSGVSRNMIAAYEAGQAAPRPGTLDELIKHLNLSTPEQEMLEKAARMARAKLKAHKRKEEDQEEDVGGRETTPPPLLIVPEMPSSRNVIPRLSLRYFAGILLVLGAIFLTRNIARMLMPCQSWDLTSDARSYAYTRQYLFSGDIYGVNPFGDSCGNSDVWRFMKSGLAGASSTPYTLITEYTQAGFDVVGLIRWQNNLSDDNSQLPIVGINTTNRNQTYKFISWPANTVLVHPSISQDVIVGWHSHIQGIIQIEGSVTDMDPSCGDGISWSIYSDSAKTAQGDISNGGKQNFMSGKIFKDLKSVSVKRGDYIYFIINAKNSEHCDSTALAVAITNVTP